MEDKTNPLLGQLRVQLGHLLVPVRRTGHFESRHRERRGRGCGRLLEVVSAAEAEICWIQNCFRRFLARGEGKQQLGPNRDNVFIIGSFPIGGWCGGLQLQFFRVQRSLELVH